MAIIIFLAFMFRLLFVNIYLFASPSPLKIHHRTSHFSNTHKRRRNPEVATKSGFETNTVVEVFEENPDNEEHLVKANSSVVLAIIYSFIKHITFSSQSNRPFDLIKCELYPKKYLAFSTLRI